MSGPSLRPLITSRDNPLVQRLRRLLGDASAYRREGEICIEGEHLCSAFLARGHRPQLAVLSESAWQQPAMRGLVAAGLTVQLVADRLFEQLSALPSPAGVAFLAAMPVAAAPDLDEPAVLLDRLQDPGNVGTVIRTAAALGVTATVALPGTVDLWNAKVVRSTMGALFVHPALPLTWDAFVAYTAAHTIPIWAADTEGVPLEQVSLVSLPAHLALVVSNEGAGLSEAVSAAVTSRVAIRMAPGIESLNVAVAAGILLHSLRVV